jgi:sarcosine oxidase, subunit beta
LVSKAEVVIIGGGIVGASIAYQLTLGGCRDVVILERESHQGKGSTGKSMGGVRAQFSTPSSIQMSLYSIPFFRDFEKNLGYPSGYRAQGYLLVATNERHMGYLRTNVGIQHGAGLDNVRLVSREEILSIVPQLKSDDIAGGTFCPTDGFVDPYSVMNGFTLRACDAGAKIFRDAEVVGIDLDSRGVSCVRTASGSISTRTVVNATGAWSAGVAKMAGLDLPVEPLRRMLVPTEPFDKISHGAPMTIDLGSGFHFRPEGLGLLMAWCDPAEKPSFNTNFDRAFVEKILTLGVARVPVLEEVAVNPSRAWAGLYEMTPDHHPILGRAPGIDGFWLASGFSGHGVMHSPATGKIMADLILRGSTDLIDARTLNYERFAEGRMVQETAVF